LVQLTEPFFRKVEPVNRFSIRSLSFPTWFLALVFVLTLTFGNVCTIELLLYVVEMKEIRNLYFEVKGAGIELHLCFEFVQHPLKQNKIERAYIICEELRRIRLPKLLKGLL